MIGDVTRDGTAIAIGEGLRAGTCSYVDPADAEEANRLGHSTPCPEVLRRHGGVSRDVMDCQ